MTLTGQQFTISSGDFAATVVEVGGGLRSFTYRGEDVTATYPETELPPKCCGGVLVPWPNRLRGGRYSFGGVSYQLPITEPAVGFGFSLGLSFFHDKPQVVNYPGQPPRVIMPSMTIVAGATTESGTWSTALAHIGVWNPTARPNPPTTIKNVATKPKKVAPFGNRMLAVFTGLGQRRTLLSPLISIRQPRIARSTASARIIKVEFSTPPPND